MARKNDKAECKANLNMFSIAFVHGNARDLGEPDLNRLILAGLIEPANGSQPFQITEAGKRVLEQRPLKSEGKS